MDLDKPAHVRLLEDWQRSYRPQTLFNADGRPVPELLGPVPVNARRMGMNLYVNGGLLLKDRQRPVREVKEATARIKINKLLEGAGWRFFQEGNAPANIRLEPRVTLKSTDLDALGDNFETTTKGFVDFLLLDARSFPLLVIEAKAENKNPLVAKEQARKYARSQNCRFVILSNGNLHYFWDLERGNPYVITSCPTLDSVTGYQKVTPNPQRLIEEPVGDDYIVHSQRPHYQSAAAWHNEAERPDYIQANKLRFSAALSAQGHSQPAGGGRRRSGSLPVRDGYGYRQDPDRRRRHQALSSFQQCAACAVPRRSP